MELITIHEDLIEINNVTSIIEFNSSSFNIKINDINYLIKGDNLEMLDVSNNNTKIKIKGKFNQITKIGFKEAKREGFFKRLIK